MARKRRVPRAKIHEVNAENDIRYRGPLTYQHFQILGWLCIVVSQVALLLQIGAKLDPSVAELYQSAGPLLESFAEFSLPLLLIANFAQILDSSDGYKNQLLKNAGASLGVFLASFLFFDRYIVGALAAVSSNPADARPVLEGMVHLLSPAGFVSFNLFIDLFLCTLVMLFLNYRPKRFFQGKLLHVFRLFALLPIAYEVVCMVLKVQSAKGIVRLPLWSFPLLTVKPPMTFVLFILLAVFVKIRELRFRRHGKGHEEYQEFLKTNKNSWNFSVFLAIMMVCVSVLDFVVMTGYSVVGTVQTLNENELNAAANASPSPGAESVETAEGPLMVLENAASESPAPQEAAGAQETEEMQTISELNLENMTETEVLQALTGLLGEESIDLSLFHEAEASTPEPMSEEERMTMLAYSTMESELMTAEALGFGGSINLILLAPLVLLFSYTKTPRNPKVGIFIPAGGIALIFFLYLEAFRLALWNLPISKLDLSKMADFFRNGGNSL